MGSGLSLSRDHGLTWTPLGDPPNFHQPSFTVPDPRHAGWIYLVAFSGSTGYLYLSANWGVTWTLRPAPPGGIESLLFDPDLPDRLYATVFAGPFIYVSDDGGSSWRAPGSKLETSNMTPPALLSRQCMGGALIISLAGRQGVASSLDFGETWQPAQFSSLNSDILDLAAGPGCAVYAARSMTSDAFVAKLAPGGSEVLWSTFLGGSDRDTSAALALDGEGNVYVAGNTASIDFPTTGPRLGPQGEQKIFAVKFDPDGKLIYSVVFGGEYLDAATALALNARGEAHLAGWTLSKSFPATPGAFQTQAGTGDGFAAKLGADGRILYISYLPFATSSSSSLIRALNPPQEVAVAAEVSGSALFGAVGGAFARMSPDGSNLTTLPRQPGQIIAMETDAQGSIYIAGQVTGPGTGSGSCFAGFYPGSSPLFLPPRDIFLTKLQADNLEQVFSTRLFGSCQSWPGTFKVGPTGEITMGLWTFGSFPVRSPVLPFLNCGGSAVISRLSADGSSLLFSTYLDMCGQAAPVALAPDGSVYAGVTRLHAAVLRIPVAQPGGLAVEGAVNAFSGSSGYGSPGMLLTIPGENLASESIDLGLDYPNALPTQLGGVQVLFDGVPAEMFQVGPDHLICVVPASVKGKDAVTVQVVNGPQSSTPFVLHVSLNEGFLTRTFPNLPPEGSVDGNVRNADGTLNDAQHPAAFGSTVTFFATGIETPGVIPVLWNAPPPQRFEQIFSLTATARRVPGFIDALWALDFRIPDAPGPGVYLVPTPGVLTRAELGRVGSGIGVYVK